MLRYRCSHCSQLLQAHELRAGKKSVCNACVTSHIIPADRSLWLNEAGEPLFPVVETTSPASDTPPPGPGLKTTLEAPVSAAHVPEHVAATAPAPVLQPVAVAVEAPLREPEPPMRDHQETPTTPPPPRPAPRVAPPLPPALPALAAPAVRERPRSTPPRPVSEPGAAPLGAPVHVDTQADIAAAITSALTQRMKPRRRPRRDLRLSTALWLLLTGAGIACVLATLFTTTDCSTAALVLGGLQVACGYGWIVSMTAQRAPQRGVACAVPPVTFYYLGQWKYGRLRPLRFVASGLVIAGVALLLPRVMETTRAWVGAETPTLVPLPPVPSEVSKLQQLRDYRDQKSFDKLIDLLRVLTKTDAILSEDARNREDLATEMKALCSHVDTGVKIAALAAYTRWGGDDARDLCLDALGRTEDEQLMALQLLPKWKESDTAPVVANAIAGVIGRPNRVTSQAASALEEIGGSAAESATLDMLLRSREQNAQLVALDVLGRVGGPVTVKSLEGYIGTILDQSIKAKTRDTIEVIQARLAKPKK